jgi:HK97 family phage major capsid protein
MTKEIREILATISEHNKILDQIKKTDIDKLSESELKDMKSIVDGLKDMKNQLKDLSDEEGTKVMFDADGYAQLIGENLDSYSLDDDFFENKSNLTGNGGTKSMDKFKVFSKAHDLIKAYANTENLDLGKYVKGALTGKWDNAASEMNQFKALSTSTSTVLIPQTLSAQILAKVMNKSLIYGSGVPMVDMPNGNLTIAKVTKNPDVAFKGEGQVAAGLTFDSTKGTYSTGTAEFAGISLKSKTIYGVCKVNDEVLSSAENLTEVLIQAFSDAIADGIDKACIYGTGTKNTDGTDNPNPQILGIANTTGINTVASSGDISTAHYVPFVQAVGAIRKANGEPTTLGINSDTDTSLNLLTNGNGDPLGVPQVVSTLNRKVSNNLRNNLGTGSNESEALVYDPASMVIGQQISVSFQVSNQALDAFATGSTYFRIFTMIDLAVLRPEYITRITGLK